MRRVVVIPQEALRSRLCLAMTTDPARTPGRGRILTGAKWFGLLGLLGLVSSSTIRNGVEVTWLVHQMRSGDVASRVGARERLLEIGRPAIDAWLSEIVTGLVADAFEEQRQNDERSFVLFMGRPIVRDPRARFGLYRIEEVPEHVLDGNDHVRVPFDLWVPGPCRLLLAPSPGEEKNVRALLLGRWNFVSASDQPGRGVEALADIDLVVSLDDRVGPAIVASVKDYLAKRRNDRGEGDPGPRKKKKT